MIFNALFAAELGILKYAIVLRKEFDEESKILGCSRGINRKLEDVQGKGTKQRNETIRKLREEFYQCMLHSKLSQKLFRNYTKNLDSINGA